jgi:hypothetical protein
MNRPQVAGFTLNGGKSQRVDVCANGREKEQSCEHPNGGQIAFQCMDRTRAKVAIQTTCGHDAQLSLEDRLAVPL